MKAIPLLNLLFILLLCISAKTQGLTAEPGTKIIIEPGAYLDITGGNLNLLSGSDYGISLLDLGTLSFSGGGVARASVYISEGRWHLVSSPVSGEVSGLFLDDYLQNHVETGNNWIDIVPVNIPLIPMKGYGLWSVNENPGPEIFSGTTNTGNQQFNFTHSGLGWNLTGNPYPSPIDWDNVAIPDGLNAAIWLFDPTIGTFGDYRYYIPGGGPANTASPVIQPGQGFFIRAVEGISGVLSFDNSVRVPDNSAFYKDEANPEILILKVSGNEITTQTAIRFDEQATEKADRLLDVTRILPDSPDVPVLFSGSLSEPLAINSLPLTDEITEIPLWFKAGIAGIYTIKSELTEDFNSSRPIWLEDLTSGFRQDLRKNPVYNFSFSNTVTESEFLLRFTEPAAGDRPQNISVRTYGSTLYVSFNGSNYQNSRFSSDVTITDLVGRTLYHTRVQDINNVIRLEQLNLGSYILMVSSPFETITEKVFIK